MTMRTTRTRKMIRRNPQGSFLRTLRQTVPRRVCNVCFRIFQATLLRVGVVVAIAFTLVWIPYVGAADVERRYASSDNQSGYVHWIDLYDSSNTKINPTAANPKPYSPLHTCGRCHDFETIAHGWHFNAIDPTVAPGRRGQPWVWSDGRTGTHLPLSYRDWSGTFRPQSLGISQWEMTAHFGGYLPGGGPGDFAKRSNVDSKKKADEKTEEDKDLGTAELPTINEFATDRSAITGSLPVDCMLCHRDSGSDYSPFVWTEQVEQENFAYAPSVASGIASIEGNLKRLKDDFDPKAEGASEKLPKLTYDIDRFRSDGKIFFDVVRKPSNDACYYCHTNVDSSAVTGERWLHDDDIHIRAGIACADCHRNGLDHHTVRGFEGESHAGGTKIASLSCQGCHVGSETQTASAYEAAGRLGAPTPAHHGIPPLHFDKISCTACHSGPSPSETVSRELNSILHRLGEHERRTGQELPAVVGPLVMPLAEPGEEPQASRSKYTPQRLMWPSYWGTLKDAKITPLHPEESYELLRKSLKVRRDFTAELAEVKLPLSKRTELLGPERSKLKPDELAAGDLTKLAAAEAEAREQQIQQRIGDALLEIGKKYPEATPVYITGGTGFSRDADGKVSELEKDQLGDAGSFYSWPIAHNVRPATMSWGAKGCTECHREQSPWFDKAVQPISLMPNHSAAALISHQLQSVDRVRIGQWNQMFAGRSSFKYMSFIAMGLTLLAILSAFVGHRRPPLLETNGISKISGLVYGAFFVCIAVLSITSFGSLWSTGHVLGYPLLAHLTAAGAFVFLLLFVAVIYLPLRSSPQTDEALATEKRPASFAFSRVTLWGLVIASVVTAGSMLISMLPVLDTPGLRQAALVHRYSGLLVAGIAVVHLLSIRRTKLKSSTQSLNSAA